jgi:hypothetical protein
MRCLEKDREQRMPDIPTLMNALRPFAPASAQAFAPVPPPSIPGPPLLGPADVISHPSQPSTLLSHATTEPPAASLMTRSAWAAPPQHRRSQLLALQIAAAVVVFGLVTWGFIRIRRSGTSSADSGAVEGVGPVQPAAALTASATTPTSAAGATEGIIDETFAPPPTLAAPPPAASVAKAPPPPAASPSTPIIRSGWGNAKTTLSLKDRDGMNVGTVPKGGVVRVIREEGGWSLVMHTNSGGMLMGWVPATAVGPATPAGTR